MIISMAKAKKLVSQGNYVLITKDQMKKAVMTEPLIRDRWVVMEEPGCPVCAVGAILRSAGVRDTDIAPTAIHAQYAAGDHSSAQLLDQGHYLMALSARFETWALKDPNFTEKPFRKKLAAWIDRNMPENLLVRTAL